VVANELCLFFDQKLVSVSTRNKARTYADHSSTFITFPPYRIAIPLRRALSDIANKPLRHELGPESMMSRKAWCSRCSLAAARVRWRDTHETRSCKFIFERQRHAYSKAPGERRS